MDVDIMGPIQMATLREISRSASIHFSHLDGMSAQILPSTGVPES